MAKTTLTLLFNLLLVLAINAQYNKQESRTADGFLALWGEGNLKDYHKDGEWKYYWANGKLCAVGKYESDKPLGKWLTYNEQGESDGCNYPPPNKGDMMQICRELYERTEASDESELNFLYQQTLWKISGAIEGVDNLETTRAKIQCMWNRYRKLFGCNHNGVFLPEENLAKFGVDVGFSGFIHDAVKEYNLDMNFIDPADGKTVLDFLHDRAAYYKTSPVDMSSLIKEYNRLYDMLKSHGAKHAKDL